MGGKIKTWIRQELEKGEDPELLRMSLRAQDLDPAMVEEVRLGEEEPLGTKIPWKRALPIVLLLAVIGIATLWLNPMGGETHPGSNPTTTLETSPIEGLGFIQGLEKSLQEHGSYTLEAGLEENHCYSLYNDWDSEGNFLGVKEVYSPTMTCLGDTVNDTKLRTPHFVNIEFHERRGSCICNDQVVVIETSEIQDRNKTTINLGITKK